MGSYHDLDVFKLSRQLNILTYKAVIAKLPKSEIYALSSQMRRAVTSITFKHCRRIRKKDSKGQSPFPVHCPRLHLRTGSPVNHLR